MKEIFLNITNIILSSVIILFTVSLGFSILVTIYKDWITPFTKK